ncbi:MAG: hypothetical protein K2X50_01630 [Gammaproteobacteria bacterium]|nr:hypothetical protein [Gammaproteobacteria bacterium]
MKAPTIKEEGPFTYFFKSSRRFNGKYAPNIITFEFKDEQTALSFFNEIKQRLPLLNTDFPKLDHLTVHLTKEESLFFLRLVMSESGVLNPSFLDDSLLKTLRADEFDFSHHFILGIIPGEKNARRLQNLRPNQRKTITITPDGTITSRSNKKPMYTAKEKEGFSQIQSTTLIDPHALSRAFGFSRNLRNSKLYGIITHTDDALFNRLLTNDSGTVVRIFDFNSKESAEASITWLKERCYSPSQIKEFRKANQEARKSNPYTNEVLARIRFNPYRSVVCICADTLEARLLAYDFAQEILDHYKIYAEQNGLTLNPNFRIPIIFYIANQNSTSFHRHIIKLYSDDMRKKDEAKAISIYNDPVSRVEHYKRNDFEFLLGLPEVTPEILLDECMGKPLAYIMLEKGYTRMLMRLFRTKAQARATQEASCKSSLRVTVFEALINYRPYLFSQYDPIISRLVLAEQFDLADRLITATGSKKELLAIENHVLEKGTPRQIAFFDLETMILKAARRGLWVTVKLCLKEFTNTNISQSTLKQLSLITGQSLDFCTSAFLVQTLPKSTEILNRHLSTATNTGNWDQIIELVKSSYSLLDQQLLENAFFDAIKRKNSRLPKFLLQLNIRNHSEDERSGHRISGSLFYALTNGLVELIPDLIELERKSQDEFSPVRFLVALELAHEIGNPETIALFEKNSDLACVTDSENVKKAICFLVISSLSDNNPDLAEKRLLRLCHKYEFLSLQNRNIYDAFKIIIGHLNMLAKSDWNIHSEFLIPFLTSLFLKNQDTDNLRVIINDNDNQRGHIFYESRNSVYKSLLSQLTHQNLAFIKGFIETFIGQSVEKSYSSMDWKKQMIRSYEDATRGEELDEDKAFLLFDMGLELLKEDFSTIFEDAIKRRGFNLAKFIFEHPKVDDEVRDQMIEVLVKYPDSINLFEAQLTNKVKPCHIKQFSSLYPFEKAAQLATLLSLVDLDKYRPEDYLWEFYSAFTFNLSTDFIVMDTLSELLTPSMMRHMMLIFVVYMFRAIDLFRDEIEKPIESCKWPKLTQAIKTNDQLQKLCFYQTENSARLNSHHADILDTLNTYFIDINQLPYPELTNTTFSRVIQLFDGTVSKNRLILPFYATTKPALPEFNKLINTLMRSLNQKIKSISCKITSGSENNSTVSNEVRVL